MDSAEPKDTPAASPDRFVEVALGVPLFQNFTYRVPDGTHAVEMGDVVRAPFAGRELFGVVATVSETTTVSRVKEFIELLPEEYRVEPARRELARQLSEYYGCAHGEALHLCIPPRPGTAFRKSPVGVGAARKATPAPQLTAEQIACIDAVAAPLDARRFESFLLQGVTGSGKTEVYLQLIARCLDQGRSALVLLPEIALTPQTLRRLRERFPGQVAPYHSRLSHGERCAVWEAAAKAEVKVVVGARSATFVPLRDLGLIVVDEEHEPSFKADGRPRYHGRDVALLRAAIENVPLLMGSATPSLESHQNALSGKHHRLLLPERVSGVRTMPLVRILDRRGDRQAWQEPISAELAEAVEDALGRDEQAILFHNRRGFARYLQCAECGDVVECPHCDISLTYHLGQDLLRCHYCGHSRTRPRKCAACSSEMMDPRGTGTQRVELALETRFPGAQIVRLDQDSTTRKHDHHRILERFGKGEADILVGTQMVAKGLHFPRVTVVGIIDADQGLHFPDFRAHERAFQLLTQVAGRSGRGREGQVIVQTLDPEHRVFAHLVGHDVESFLAEEAQQRSALGYPPFRRLAAITATASTEEKLEQVLERVAVSLRHHLPADEITILGPARAVLARINRRHRGQLLLKGNLGPARKRWILELFEEILAGTRGGRSIDLILDVDPLHLL